MSGPTDRRDERPAPDADVVRSPGSGLGAPEEERTAYTTTQTSGGLGAGDPSGGPQKTAEREQFEEERTRATDRPGNADPRDVTPPHGDRMKP